MLLPGLLLTERRVRLHKFSQTSARLCRRRLSGQFIWTSWMTNALIVWHNQHCVQDVPQPWFLKTRMSELCLYLSSSKTPWPASTMFVLTLNNRMTQYSQTRKESYHILASSSVRRTDKPYFSLCDSLGRVNDLFHLFFLSRRLVASQTALLLLWPWLTILTRLPNNLWTHVLSWWSESHVSCCQSANQGWRRLS